MKRIVFGLFLLVTLTNCKTKRSTVLDNSETIPMQKNKFTIAFGSCNKHDVTNNLWDDILNVKPDVWVWGGDVVYADTEDMGKLKRIYAAQNEVSGYQQLKAEVPVVGTWDDHDYGVNDGGTEFSKKKESQQQFLDFLEVPTTSARRNREGVYALHEYNKNGLQVAIFVLDTRYFRTTLTPDTKSGRSYKPSINGEGTMLGETQWKWLAEKLSSSKADFNIIVSSIQFLSDQHGYEKWANMPHEVKRLENLIVGSKAEGVVILSGDRHISEFSKKQLQGVPYPLIDFTSSGLTHSYSNFTSEENAFRIGEVIATKSFGVVAIDTETKNVSLKIIGDNGEILQELKQHY